MKSQCGSREQRNSSYSIPACTTPKKRVMRQHLWEGKGPVVPEAVSLADSASGYVWPSRTPLLTRVAVTG